jgi:ABC-type polysaccharide/polyol phosphate transport system ATPase subunit
MTSTASSDVLVSVNNVRMFFELNHYRTENLREVFVSLFNHPIDYLFKKNDLFFVLDDISFEVKRGMRVGILGVNGSGKTTLCRCLAKMMKPHAGIIKTPSNIRAIFDVGNGIMPELTGRENAKLLARLFFPELVDVSSVVNDAVEFSELGHFIDIPFKQYSKGMQSRLILSLISARATELLILDEVFDGADIFFQKKIAERMKKLIQAAGATIFVSHSIEQVRELCNQVMVLHQGRIHFFGEVTPGIEKYLSLNALTSTSASTD